VKAPQEKSTENEKEKNMDNEHSGEGEWQTDEHKPKRRVRKHRSSEQKSIRNALCVRENGILPFKQTHEKESFDKEKQKREEGEEDAHEGV